ncbi:hypothetical protein TNCV_1054931 [Trichonephila clavipes]|nr:hypothetical protein TNCV_1054931 [Trichonephila clavipes]
MFMDGEKLQPLLVTGLEHLKTTAGIAPKVVRVLKPLQHVKLRIPTGFRERSLAGVGIFGSVRGHGPGLALLANGGVQQQRVSINFHFHDSIGGKREVALYMSSQDLQVWFPHFRHYQHAMNMNRYTNAELADIHFINGLTNGNRCADV